MRSYRKLVDVELTCYLLSEQTLCLSDCVVSQAELCLCFSQSMRQIFDYSFFSVAQAKLCGFSQSMRQIFAYSFFFQLHKLNCVSVFRKA